MDSAWNLYLPFDKLSPELRLVSKTMHEASATKEGTLGEQKLTQRIERYLFMIAGI